MTINPKSANLSFHPVAAAGELLSNELQGVRDVLRQIVESDDPLIREVGEYVCLTSGKLLRPMVTLLIHRAFCPAVPPPVKIAAAMETIHVATLLHDDVIDKAKIRRGHPSVNARWGDDVAILMADYLFAWVFDLALSHLDNAPLRLISRVTRRMCEGEMFQIERRGTWLSSEDYITIITAKTAALFSACSALAGLCGGLDPDAVSRLSNFGLQFGLAFQITDDILDFTAADGHWGKRVGMDLAEGKQTLPLILTLRDASPADRDKLAHILSNGRDFNQILATIHHYQAIDHSREIASGHIREALSSLNDLPVYDESARDCLQSLTEFLLRRPY